MSKSITSSAIPVTDNAKEEWLTEIECRQNIGVYSGLLLLRPGLAVLISPFLPAEPRALAWIFLVGSMCFSDNVYRLYRAIRDYRTVKKTGEPILMTPFRKASYEEGDQWYGAVLMSLLVLGTFALLCFMSFTQLSTKPAYWVVSIMISLVSMFFARQYWTRWAGLRRKRIALTPQIAPTNAVPFASVSETPTIPKHWWTSNDTRDEVEQTRRR